MKKIFLMLLAGLLCVSLLASFVACDEKGDETSGEDEKGVSKESWDNMINAANFENYTLDYQGTMTVYENDGYVSEATPVHALYRATADAFEFVTYDENEIAMSPMVFTGEAAVAQKANISQLFLAILGDYNNFTYDEGSKAYVIKNCTVNMDASMIINGEVASELVPVTIEVKEGTATVSDDGKILKLVCEYTQTMTVGGNLTKVGGNTTWTFSDYGTTVINAAN